MIPLWSHQAKCVELAKDQHDFAILFEMGAGKTATMIHILRNLFADYSRRTIIFCPPLVIPNWLNEFKLHAELLPGTVVPLYGSGIKRFKTFIEQASCKDSLGKPSPRIFVTNYESLSMKDLFDAFKIWQPQVLVFDESHKLKSPKAKRSKLAAELANPYLYKRNAEKPHTYLLTGTAVLNSGMDIFQQFLVMDGGETFTTNFFKFRGIYFRDKNAAMPRDRYFPDWIIKEGAEEEINRKIFAKAFRVTKEEALDLPPEVIIPVKVGMGPEQKRLYDEMKRDLISFYNSKACVASLAITKLGRLMEICSGFVTTEGVMGDKERKRHRLANNPKMDALQELLEGITEDPKAKVIIWAVYRENYPMIAELCEKLKLKYVEVHGDSRNKSESVEAFQKDPAVRVFVGHPGSGGIGINLTVAGFDITYSRSHNLADHLQARARNHRGGSRDAGHTKITHYELVCDKTVDSICLEKLASKQDMSEKVLKDIIQEMQTNDKSIEPN